MNNDTRPPIGGSSLPSLRAITTTAPITNTTTNERPSHTHARSHGGAAGGGAFPRCRGGALPGARYDMCHVYVCMYHTKHRPLSMQLTERLDWAASRVRSLPPASTHTRQRFPDLLAPHPNQNTNNKQTVERRIRILNVGRIDSNLHDLRDYQIPAKVQRSKGRDG